MKEKQESLPESTDSVLQMLSALLGPEAVMDKIMNNITSKAASRVAQSMNFAYPTANIVSRVHEIFRPTEAIPELPEETPEDFEFPHENVTHVRLIVCAAHGNLTRARRERIHKAAEEYAKVVHEVYTEHLAEAFPDSEFIPTDGLEIHELDD